MRRQSILWASVFVGMSVAYLSPAVATSPRGGAAAAARPGSNGMIAFTGDLPSRRDDIFVMNPDGSAVTKIAGTRHWERSPRWSPNGTTIAYERGRCTDERTCGAYAQAVDWWIYTMKPDGSGVTRITRNDQNAQHPTWSPDGKQIAYTCVCANDDIGYSIWITSADGSTRTQTDLVGHSLAWSPDGSSLAYVYREDIWSAKIDGSEQVNLTKSKASEGPPSWSPDGTKIAYAAVTSSSEYNDIRVMNADGSDDHKIGSGEEYGGSSPAWSPDGARIVYLHRSKGQIVSIRSGGEGLRLLTPEPEDRNYGDPDWGTRTPRQVKDPDPPQTKVNKPGGADRTTTRRSATLKFRSNEPGTTFECWMDSSPNGSKGSACKSPKTYRGLKPGYHYFFVRATDRAGNADRSSAVAYWIINKN